MSKKIELTVHALTSDRYWSKLNHFLLWRNFKAMQSKQRIRYLYLKLNSVPLSQRISSPASLTLMSLMYLIQPPDLITGARHRSLDIRAYASLAWQASHSVSISKCKGWRQVILICISSSINVEPDILFTITGQGAALSSVWSANHRTKRNTSPQPGSSIPLPGQGAQGGSEPRSKQNINPDSGSASSQSRPRRLPAPRLKPPYVIPRSQEADQARGRGTHDCGPITRRRLCSLKWQLNIEVLK